jgi:hypothetical protein
LCQIVQGNQDKRNRFCYQWHFCYKLSHCKHNFIHAPSFSNSLFFAESIVKYKVVLNKVGHLLVCKQSKRGCDTPKLINTLRSHDYIRLKLCSHEFNVWAFLKAPFLYSKNKQFFFNKLGTNMLKT